MMIWLPTSKVSGDIYSNIYYERYGFKLKVNNGDPITPFD